jgi:hypothetical protein
MRLYQHSARCPVALRTFLDCNPDYWCFILFLWQDVEEANMIFLQQASNGKVGWIDNLVMTADHSQRLSHYMDRVSIPRAAYGFSYEQCEQQRLFFHQFLSLPRHQQRYSTIDLYQYAIIAVRE